MTDEGDVKALEISKEDYVEDADLDMIAGGGFGSQTVGGVVVG